MSINGDRLGHVGNHGMSDILRLRDTVAFRQQDSKLVPADPRDRIVRSHGFLQAASHLAENAIAYRVAKRGVDVLEPIEVDHDYCCRQGERERLFHTPIEARAVGEPGEDVDVR
ncbi:hypothetical protein D3C72_1547850 [compost metagenome]